LLTKSARFFLVNCISGGRLVAAPVFVFFFSDRTMRFAAPCMILLLAMFLSDILDGAAARRWNVTSAFGYVLDGVADRSTVIALIVSLTALGRLPPLLSFFLLLRDILLYAARSLFAQWWTANGQFRARVRFNATVFYALLASLAFAACTDRIGFPAADDFLGSAIQHSLVLTTWLFVVWTYTLLAQQIWAYRGTATGGGA
jgi:phosphatidylglycerophosphate synthase